MSQCYVISKLPVLFICTSLFKGLTTFSHLLLGLPKPADCPERTVVVLFNFARLLQSGAKVACHSMFNILSLVSSELCLTLYVQRNLLVLGIHRNDIRKEKNKNRTEEARKEQRKRWRWTANYKALLIIELPVADSCYTVWYKAIRVISCLVYSTVIIITVSRTARLSRTTTE